MSACIPTDLAEDVWLTAAQLARLTGLKSGTFYVWAIRSDSIRRLLDGRFNAADIYRYHASRSQTALAVRAGILGVSLRGNAPPIV